MKSMAFFPLDGLIFEWLFLPGTGREGDLTSELVIAASGPFFRPVLPNRD
jgi:hypothetical protein